MEADLIQKFGFSEMYEWGEVPDPKYRLGRFVTFDEQRPEKIVPVKDDTQFILGITTVNSVIDSDDPDNWKYKDLCNEFGDLYLRKEKLAIGERVYDQNLEMNFIQTKPWEHYVTVPNKYYNKDLKYTKRTNRGEWVRVNLMGKTIVEDDGTCEAGKFCMPYTGKIKAKWGTAIPATDDAKHKYYVLMRLSAKTILVINKNI